MLFSRVLLTIAYDGTDFFGWDCQQNRSIKQTLLDALSSLVEVKELVVASRTDRGVHAREQKILLIPKTAAVLSLEAFKKRLPADLSLINAQVVPEDFHPSICAKTKEYHYFFHTISLPHLERFSLEVSETIDLKAIKEALPLFIGCHDFRAFEDIGSNSKRRENSICNITHLSLEQTSPYQFFLKIVGDRFLYHMCRKIAGTLLYIGYGKLQKEPYLEGLSRISRSVVGPTLPANGLILHKIIYDRDDPLYL